MTTVAGGPMPHKLPNGVELERSIVTVADGKYSADDVFFANGSKMNPITKGTIEASDDRIMFVTGNSKKTMAIAGDTLTRVDSPDVFLYKRRTADEGAAR